ncbi:MAG: hypothetical protein OEW15_08515 [Nitrospirota bacterium]|nr:hypothetical protein [Nitrospirota bacterium]
MDPYSRWTAILTRSRKRKLLPLDIEHCSPIALRSIVLDAHTSTHVLDRIAQVYCDDEYILRDLVRCPNLSETTLAFIALTASDEIKNFIAGTRVMDVVTDEAPGQAAADAGKKKKLNVTQMVNRMTTPQKIKLAISGGKEARGLLIRESNKQISQAVLANPQIKDNEIEFFAKSTNLSEDVLRKIGMNSEWTKKASIAHALVHNPRCPVGIAVGFVPRMGDKDLAMLEKSKSVSNAVRTAARALLARKKSGGKKE